MPGDAYQPTERRPLAARSWAVSRQLTSWLSRQGVAPNLISIIGMLASLVGGGLLAFTPFISQFERLLWLGAALLVGVRGLANMLDGMVAIESKRASPVG